MKFVDEVKESVKMSKLSNKTPQAALAALQLSLGHAEVKILKTAS